MTLTSKVRDSVGRGAPCPNKRIEYLTKALAEDAAVQQSEDLGERFMVYRCRCGWWHTRNKTKKDRNRKRKPAGRRRRAASKRWRKVRDEMPLRMWEDDGGACVFPHEDD